MARLFYVLGAILLWGIVQADVINRFAEPAVIEELRNRESTRIVGGWPAEVGQIPHQVSLRIVNPTGGVTACGGSIIHHEWILTAAHCVANRITFVVRAGLTNLTRPDYITETTRKYIGPGYNEAGPAVQTDDIALVGLELPIPYGPTVQPIRLHNSQQWNSNYKGVVLTVSGFGRTDDAWNGGINSEILLWTHLRGLTNEECLTWYPNSQVIAPQTICAEFYNDTAQSSCQGDSGGPLTLVDVDGKLSQIGVVSFGSSRGCNNDYPAGYVRPGYYHDWFNEVTGMSFDWSSEDLESIKIDQAPSDKVNVVDA